MSEKGYIADDLKILEGLEAVRMRPGMYIGSTGIRGLHHILWEIVDNSVDEAANGYADEITVKLHADGSASVEDNGRGMPTDVNTKAKMSGVEVIFTKLHAGGKFDDSVYKTSGGLHGVGSSVVNALSSYLDIEVSRDGFIHHDHYKQGSPTLELTDGLLPIIGKTKKTGTKINFLPDPEIFEKTRFKAEEVKSRMHETAYLNPELTIIFEDRRASETERIVFHEPDGLVGFVKDINHSQEAIHDVVYFKGECEGITVEGAFFEL